MGDLPGGPGAFKLPGEEEVPGAVLFCCTMNSVRSPMAEGILKQLIGTKIYVDSAGVREGEVDGFAVAVMKEIGIDISKHHAKTFDDLEDSSFDLIISLSPEAQHSAVEMTRTMACGEDQDALRRGDRLETFRPVGFVTRRLWTQLDKTPPRP